MVNMKEKELKEIVNDMKKNNRNKNKGNNYNRVCHAQGRMQIQPKKRDTLYI